MSLSQSELKSIVSFDPETGDFIWLRALPNGTRPGAAAGSVHNTGYVRIGIAGRSYLAHRLAWLYCYGLWPEREVDHINGNRADNRIANLRLATPSENQMNRSRGVKNSSGQKGVCWDAAHGKWRVRIRACGKRFTIGSFSDFGDACAAYRRAAVDLHGDFARLS